MRNPEAEAKRSRSVYTSRADLPLYKLFAKYQYLTVEMAAKLLPRDIGATQRRLLALYRAARLGRVSPSEDRNMSVIGTPPFVYFLDKKGGTIAADLGYLPEPRWIDSKSRMTIGHDLEITKYHLALENALQAVSEPLEWAQWRGELLDRFRLGAEEVSIIPDAYFRFHNQSYFLEIVKAKESEYKNGESNIERKVRCYMAYPDRFRERYGHKDFRVIFVLPTQERVARLLGKLEDEYPYRRFYLTDEASYQRDILGPIYWTPKDFRDMTYGLLA